jgi:antitoxin ParD1/3/4
MTALTVEVPETLEAWVRQRVERGDYASAEDYLRDLIGKDKEYEIWRKELEAALIEGEESGISERTVNEIIAAAEERLQNEGVKIKPQSGSRFG